LRQIVLTGIVAFLAGPLLCEGSIAWAQSAFRLVGTIEGGPFTGAVIDDTKNPQAFYRLNDKLPDDSRLVKVLHNRIVLKLPDGTSMELYTTPGTGGGNTSAPTAAVAPSVTPRWGDQPASDRSVEPNRRAGQANSNSSTALGEDAGSSRPSRMDHQNPNTKKGISRGRRSSPRSGEED
jgi:hypothetical protein